MKIKWNEDRMRPWYKRIILGLWTITGIGLFTVLFLLIWAGQDDLPSFEELENPKYDLASIVYAIDGTPFGKYYIENREPVEFAELSPHIVHSLLSIEDARFYGHSGIDLRALIRVAFKTILLGNRDAGGGSTITQQLAKLLFERPNLRGKNKMGRMIAILKVKLKEWLTSVRLERQYTKEEIMAMYLNKFEFINGAHGIQAAAQTYFNKDQAELNIQEAATLVGMLKNPALFNPKRFPEKSEARRNVVLNQLHRYEWIDKETRDTLRSKTLDMSNFKREHHSIGPAPYFRAELTKWLKDLLSKEEFLKADGKEYNIYTDGLKIYTTIDLKYQEHAEAAVFNHMKSNQERYWKAWRGMNIFTFEADGRLKEIRKKSFHRRILESDRYQSLFKKHMKPEIEATLKENPDVYLNGTIVSALHESKNKKSTLNTLLKKEKIEEEQLVPLRKFIETKAYEDIDEKWRSFLEIYEIEFNTPIKMKVFAFNDEGEELVEMTPYDSVMYHYRHLQSGMMAVEPNTGHIKAWVGGLNHRYFKYDHINMRRQVGSTIKPFVYATAIAIQGISPCQTYDDIQYSIAPGDANFYLTDEWTPSNANGTFTGNKYNLYQGLLYSKNSITVRLVKEMGNVDVIRELLDNVGIDKDLKLASGDPLIPRLPAICLGAVDLSVKEMVGAYTTFANNGIYTEPVFITHIEDKNGKVIYQAFPNRNLALNPLYNSIMLDMLRNNTGGNFGLGVKSDNGGKTGTTNDYADGWFMGVTPSLVAGTWVGGDDKWIRFFTLDAGQGYVMARPIFKDFIKRLEDDPDSGYDPELKFNDPPPGFSSFVECDHYKQIKPEEEQDENILRRTERDEFEEEFEEFAEDGLD
jgi:penicillin-binding protein 1A